MSDDTTVCPHCTQLNLWYLTRCVHCLCDMTVADREAAQPSAVLRAFLRPAAGRVGE